MQNSSGQHDEQVPLHIASETTVKLFVPVAHVKNEGNSSFCLKGLLDGQIFVKSIDSGKYNRKGALNKFWPEGLLGSFISCPPLKDGWACFLKANLLHQQS